MVDEAEDHRGEEDGVYRFYHQSMKVFDRLQPLTKEGFQLIVKIGGETDPPNEWYCQIYQEARTAASMSRRMSAGLNYSSTSAAEISNKLFSSGVCNSMKRLVLLLLAISAIIVTSLPVKADEDRGDHNWNDEYWHHNHDGYWHGHKGHWEYKHHKHTFIQVGPVTIEQH